jgi:hypothetical protein
MGNSTRCRMLTSRFVVGSVLRSTLALWLRAAFPATEPRKRAPSSPSDNVGLLSAAGPNGVSPDTLQAPGPPPQTSLHDERPRSSVGIEASTATRREKGKSPLPGAFEERCPTPGLRPGPWHLFMFYGCPMSRPRPPPMSSPAR